MTDKRIETLRTELDVLDGELLELVAKRMNIAEKIGRVKAEIGQPILDRDRELAILRKIRARAENAGLDPDVASQLYELLFAVSREAQRSSL